MSLSRASSKLAREGALRLFASALAVIRNAAHGGRYFRSCARAERSGPSTANPYGASGGCRARHHAFANLLKPDVLEEPFSQTDTRFSESSRLACPYKTVESAWPLHGPSTSNLHINNGENRIVQKPLAYVFAIGIELLKAKQAFTARAKPRLSR